VILEDLGETLVDYKVFALELHHDLFTEAFREDPGDARELPEDLVGGELPDLEEGLLELL
jgi:hypothetical protein